VSSGSNNMLEVLLGSFTEGSSNSGQSLTTAALEILLEEFLNPEITAGLRVEKVILWIGWMSIL